MGGAKAMEELVKLEERGNPRRTIDVIYSKNNEPCEAVEFEMAERTKRGTHR